MKRVGAKGFTLIELAIVILIVGILAAVALPRFSNTTKQAQIAVARNLSNDLQSGLAIYISEQGQTPPDFTTFVAPSGAPTGAQTISLEGTRQNGRICTLSGTTITCDDAFREIKPVSYTYANGAISLNCAACSNPSGKTQ